MKKIICICMVLMMLSAAGCESKSSSVTTDTGEASGTAAEETETDATQEAAAEPVETDEFGRPVSGWDKSYLSYVDRRIEEILNTESDYSATGTVYYVSNSGNDGADGRSPETAWATLNAVNGNYNNYQPGDTILFERGGIWRGHVSCADGVTVSAYGEGEKPRVYGSLDNGADPGKWELWYEQDEVKIWKYYRLTNDCSNIVLNDGEACAYRVYSYWTGQKVIFCGGVNRDFDMVSALEYDLQFYNDYPDNIAEYTIPFSSVDADMSGALYLRCDKGNPGDIFDSIEFQEMDEVRGYGSIVQPDGSNIVIDNLCIMYSNTMGVSAGSSSDTTIQNCEIAYVGGTSLTIGHNDGRRYVPVAGEGIRLDGNGNKSINNYVHDCFDGGIILETSGQAKFKDILISGNVVERCMTGILIGVHPEHVDTFRLGNTVISDNDILYSGYGWSCDEHYSFTWESADYIGNAISFWNTNFYHDKLELTNNRLYAARVSLVQFGITDPAVFSGNMYAQGMGGSVLALHRKGNLTYHKAESDENAVSLAKELLKDDGAYSAWTD